MCGYDSLQAAMYRVQVISCANQRLLETWALDALDRSLYLIVYVSIGLLAALTGFQPPTWKSKTSEVDVLIFALLSFGCRSMIAGMKGKFSFSTELG